MKTTYRIYFAALMLIMAMVACTKEATPGKVDTDPATGNLRTIAVSFDTQGQTRTMLNGLKPTFEDGDVVLVAQNSGLVNPQECTVRKVGDNYIIQTTLQGQIQMVYPVSCAKVDKNAIVGVKVPSTQTGRFADANICMTETIEQDATTAVFKNQVAILKFYADESIGVKSITIQSDKPLISGGESGYCITVEPSAVSNNEAAAAQAASAMDSRIWYAAIYTGDQVQANNLTFTSTTTSQDNPVEKTPTATVSLVNGTMYNVFIPYYIKVQVGTDEGDNPIYQKWAYCNIGAFLPEEPGLYFAWGDTHGYKWDAENEQFEGGHVFSWANCPFCTSGNDEEQKFSKYVTSEEEDFWGDSGSPDGLTVLKPEDDAAAANWHSKWRMPTKEECLKLLNQTSTTLDNVIENKGLVINNTSLLFPFTGTGVNTGLMLPDGMGCVLTSSLFEDSSKEAYGLMFWPSRPYFGVVESSRYIGYPIRPIYDDSITEDQLTALTINPYSNGGTF